MTQVPSRIWLTISLAALTACASVSTSLGTKIYRLRADGLHRKGEVRPLATSFGYYCQSPEDYQLVILRNELDQEAR